MAAEGGVPRVDAVKPDSVTDAAQVDKKINGSDHSSDSSNLRRRKVDPDFIEDPTGSNPEESETRLCGWLNKCGNIGFVKTAKTLYFVFSDDNCKLYYYRTPQDLLPLGEIDIKHASFHFDASSQKQGLFEIR
jgi:hypothetical protein